MLEMVWRLLVVDCKATFSIPPGCIANNQILELLIAVRTELFSSVNRRFRELIPSLCFETPWTNLRWQILRKGKI